MAETHHYLGEGGVVWAHDLPLPGPIAERVTKGFLRRVNADGSPWTDPDAAPADPAAKPAASAVKAEWVGYAVRAHGVDAEEADGMTKADLIERFGRD